MTFVSENDLLTFLEDDNTTYDLFSSFGFDFDTDEQLNESNRDESNKIYQDVESCNPFDHLLQLEQMNPFFYYPEEMFGKKREAPFDELLKQEPPMKKVKYNNDPTTFDPSPIFDQEVVVDESLYEEEEDEFCVSKYQPYRFSFGFPCAMQSTENNLPPHELMNGEKMMSVVPTVKPSPACIYCRSIKKKCSSFPGNGRCDRCRKKGPHMVCMFDDRWPSHVATNLRHAFYSYIMTPYVHYKYAKDGDEI